MSSPLHDQMESALANLRFQQEKIREFGVAMAGRTTSVTSKDRMLSVAVDSNGRLVEMKFRGNRYRSLAPAELASLIIDTVAKAQETASREALDAVAELVPDAFQLARLKSGELDLDEMFDAAVRLAEQPVVAADAPGEEPGGRRG